MPEEQIIEDMVVDVSKWMPLGGSVLIRRLPNQEKNAAGIIVGHSDQTELFAQVVRTGPGRKHHETHNRIPICPVKRGDWVTCRQFEGERYHEFLSSDGFEYSIVESRTLELKVKKQ